MQILRIQFSLEMTRKEKSEKAMLGSPGRLPSPRSSSTESTMKLLRMAERDFPEITRQKLVQINLDSIMERPA